MHPFHLRAILERARALWPDRVAVVDGARRLTYAEVGARVDRLAGLLAAHGVAPGDRIAALLPNGLAYFELYHAAAALDAVLVSLNYRLTAGELAFIVADSGARWLGA
ncbi:MAG TPA: AMP-binding protein [Gemmatimonadales bacterium]|nr:AMP-binding protein [Gemmatimonadales bacterium]